MTITEAPVVEPRREARPTTGNYTQAIAEQQKLHWQHIPWPAQQKILGALKPPQGEAPDDDSEECRPFRRGVHHTPVEELLARGMTIERVAEDLGYESVEAFLRRMRRDRARQAQAA